MAKSNDWQKTVQKVAMLDQSLAPYSLESDYLDYKYTTKMKPPTDAAKETLKYFDEVTGLDDSAKNFAKAIAYANIVGTSKNFSRITTVERQDEEELKPGKFVLDMEKTNVDDILTDTDAKVGDDGVRIEEGAFRKIKFGSKAQKHNFKMALMDRAYREASEQEVATPDAELPAGTTPAMEANRVTRVNNTRKTQRKNLREAIADVNYAWSHKINVEEVRAKVSNDLVRQTTLAGNHKNELIPAPNLGEEPGAMWETKKGVMQRMGGKLFGTPECTKTLKSVLEMLIPLIESKLNKKGATELLLHCIGGDAANFIESVKDTYTFAAMFTQLQLSFASKINLDEINKQLVSVRRERPTKVNQAIAKIIELCEAKTRNLDSAERRIIRESYEKDNISGMLQFWFPEAYITINAKYSQMVMQARMQGGELKSPGEIFNQLASEYLEGIQPRSMRSAAIFSVEMMTADMGITQQTICEDIYNDISINSLRMNNGGANGGGGFNRFGMQQSRYEQPGSYRPYGTDYSRFGNENGRPSQGYARDAIARPSPNDVNKFGGDRNKGSQGGGQPLKQRIIRQIPKHFENRCLKCGVSNHIFKNCPTYSGPDLAEKSCSYCGCFHVGKCRNLAQPEMNPVEIEYEFEFVDNVEEGGPRGGKDERETGEDPEMTNQSAQQ